MTLAAPPLSLINMSRLASPDGSSGHINMMLPCPSTGQTVEVEPVSSRNHTLLLLMQDSSRTRLDSTPGHLSVCSTTDDFCSCDTPGNSIFDCPPPIISHIQTTLPPALIDSSPSALTLPSASVLSYPTDPASLSKSLLLSSPPFLRQSSGFSYNVDTEWLDHCDDKPLDFPSAFSSNDIDITRPLIPEPKDLCNSMSTLLMPLYHSACPEEPLCLDGLSDEKSVLMLLTDTCHERAADCSSCQQDWPPLPRPAIKRPHAWPLEDLRSSRACFGMVDKTPCETGVVVEYACGYECSDAHDVIDTSDAGAGYRWPAPAERATPAIVMSPFLPAPCSVRVQQTTTGSWGNIWAQLLWDRFLLGHMLLRGVTRPMPATLHPLRHLGLPQHSLIPFLRLVLLIVHVLQTLSILC